MNIIDKPTIKNLIDQADPDILIQYIEQSFIDYSSGKAVVPPVGTLSFDHPPGDVHIKYGYVREDPYYVIKIASGFYDNPQLGLPSGNGLNLVFNQKNGLPEVLLLDEAYLTDVRTALAGAVTAKYLKPPTIRTIGILGTGVQARLQLYYLKSITACRNVLAWGRNPEKANTYAQDMKEKGFQVEVAEDPEMIAQSCELIVTTTASKEAILPDMRRNGDVLITAIGADTRGKQELDFGILSHASLIAVDSLSQCKDHGEIHKALHAGLLDETKFHEVGDIIQDPNFKRPSGIVVADLTGIATQDIQISKFILDHLEK